MRIDDSRAAVRRYELKRAPEDHRLDPEVPEDPGPVHALLSDADYVIPPPPRKAGTAFERFPRQAACGAPVRVIFTMAFDTEEPDACPRCTEVAVQWQADRQA